MKNLAKQLYRRVKGAEFWESNKLTRLLYVLIQKCIGLVLYIRHIVVYAKWYIMHHVYKVSIIKRVRKNLNRKGIHLQLARKHARSGNWARSQRYYQKLETRIKHSARDLELYNETRMNLSILERLLAIDDYKKHIANYQKAIAKKPPKIAAVVAISGGYDTVKLPAQLNPDIKYILYTDSPVVDAGVYEIRPMPYFHEDKTRIARFVKTNLDQLVPGYDIALWIDANLMAMNDLSEFISDFKKSKKAVGAIPHPLRTSVYEEAEACKKHIKEDNRRIDEQAAHLWELGYSTQKLIESNFMMFDLKSKKIRGFFATWWRELDTFTRRDQLSLNYALDENKIDYYPIMKHLQNTRTHEAFSIISHQLHQTTPESLLRAISDTETDPYAGDPFSKHKQTVLKRNRGRSIDIVYCVHNALDDVKLCLASVKKFRRSSNVNLIIIDDGSQPPTKKFLEKFHQQNKSWTQLNRKETGSGYTKAANRGLRLSKGDFVILLNSDTIVSDGWTEKMADVAFSNSTVGIVGPLSSAASHQSIPNHKSAKGQTAINELPENIAPDDLNTQLESWTTYNQYPLVPLVHGFCYGIRRDVIDAIGYFDEENFATGYGEENDYCFRAMDAGFKLALATNTYIYHAKSKSYSEDDRIEFMQHGNQKLADLRGKERIKRAVVTMQNHPQLTTLRQKTRAYFNKEGSEDEV